MPVSKTQIDRLGERLKEDNHTESDLRLLDEYRRSFGEAYEAVVKAVRQSGEFPTGRLAKSTLSIAEKLRRESIRLSQMQDIAGCRIVVKNIVEQDQFVESLKVLFPGASVIDRRDNPSYGYRAVHVVVEMFGKPVEVQVRSFLQHLWAELSEKASDVLDPMIKYGGGPDEWRGILIDSSEVVAKYEEAEKSHFKMLATIEEEMVAHENRKKLATIQLKYHLSDQKAQIIRERQEHLTHELERLEQAREELRRLQVCLWNKWNKLAGLLQREISLLGNLEEKKQ